MMKNQLAGLMKQAQQMQDNLKKAQDELANVEVEGDLEAEAHGRGDVVQIDAPVIGGRKLRPVVTFRQVELRLKVAA